MHLLLIRHAKPFHVSGQEAADPDLTPEGWMQAKRLASFLSGEPFGRIDRLVSSPMQRAAQTAAALDEVLGLGVRNDDRLAELDRGWSSYGVPMEGYPNRSALFADMNAGRLGDNTFDPQDFGRRVVEGVEAAASASGESTAIVCHGGVINAYLAHILGTAQPFFHRTVLHLGDPGLRRPVGTSRIVVAERSRPPARLRTSGDARDRRQRPNPAD